MMERTAAQAEAEAAMVAGRREEKLTTVFLPRWAATTRKAPAAEARRLRVLRAAAGAAV
jgi:hypothetical protein